MDGMGAWANKTLGKPAEAPLPPGIEHITVDDLLADPNLPPEVRAWLEQYKAQGIDWAHANNPPGFVDDEAKWEKAKDAAEQAGADDVYAFANWWYQNH